ncbi:putative RING-H2 finger protein ATL21A [Primulina eburnea]|uniref:putative RING-H2 finger protein ATL21A n=1 Tax=Primulina eburnea TaxID=1245227 RepID=UPI003C6C1192
MSFNLSFSHPLKVLYYQNYTFYSCPKELVEIANLTVIDCLSNTSTSTVATSVIPSQLMKELYRCNEITTSFIPVSGFDSYGFVGNQTDLILRWLPFSCNGSPNPTGLVSGGIVETAIIMLWSLPIILGPLICFSCCVHFTKEVRLGDGEN